MCTWNKVPVRDVAGQNPPKLDCTPDFTGEQSVIGFENLTPAQCFSKCFPCSIYDLVVVETNRFASQKLVNVADLPPRSRFRKWKDVSSMELKGFSGN